MYFLISRTPSLSLSNAEIPLYDAIIKGQSSVGQLEKAFGSSTPSVLNTWWRVGILKFLEPVKRAQGCKHIAVIEPHMDDALLSSGGRLLNLCRTHRVTLLSVVKWSAFTSYIILDRSEYSDVESVTRLRSQESMVAARMIGANHVTLDESDSPLQAFRRDDGSLNLKEVRLDSSDLTDLRRRSAAWQAFAPSAAQTRELAHKIEQKLEELRPDEIWFPMGIGSHSDHIRTRDACFQLLVSSPEWFKRCRISMYEDVPYSLDFPRHSASIQKALRDTGAQLRSGAEDISLAYDRKIDLLGTYASQWKPQEIAPRVEKSAEAAAQVSGGKAEAFHDLLYFPEIPSATALAAPVLMEKRNQIARKLQEWSASLGPETALRVISLSPLGRSAGLEILSRAFNGTKVIAWVNVQYYVDGFHLDSRNIETRKLQEQDVASTLLEAAKSNDLILLLNDLPQAAHESESFEATLGLKPGRLLIAPYLGSVCSVIQELWPEVVGPHEGQ